MATDIRAVRPTWPVQGVGGHLEVEWTGSGIETGIATAEPGNLEVEQWEIIHDYDNAEMALSGGEGGPTIFRVGDAFEFTAIVLLDMKPAKDGGSANTFAGQPFLDGRLQGNVAIDANFHFALTLQVGDPAIWVQAPGRQSIALENVEPRTGLQYRCRRVILRQVRTLNSSKGQPPDGYARSIVRGQGSAPLERWIDGINVGIGGLGFTRGDDNDNGGGEFDIEQ